MGTAGRATRARAADRPTECIGPEATVSLLHDSETLTVGRFVCPVGSPLWRRDNDIRGSCMVFAWTGVEITQAGREPVVANPNHIVFHNHGTPYRRRAVIEGGEESIFFGFAPEVWAELVAAADPKGLRRPERPFRHGDAPCGSEEFLHQALLLRAIEGGGGADALGVEEAALTLARRGLRRTYGARGEHRRRRHDTERAHRDAAHEAKLYLTSRYSMPVTLGKVASHVHLSPYHLSRVFKRETGVTVYRYLVCLRLRSSLMPLGEGGTIAEVARRFGFASHAHFTGAFRNEFGVTPSRYRDGVGEVDAGRLARLSNILEG